MPVNLIQHIELRGENPRQAVLMGTNVKAYLVAQFVLGWSVDAAVEKYGLSKAKIYAAMSFYFDNLPSLIAHLGQGQTEIHENATDDKEKTEPYKRDFVKKPNA